MVFSGMSSIQLLLIKVVGVLLSPLIFIERLFSTLFGG